MDSHRTLLYQTWGEKPPITDRNALKFYDNLILNLAQYDKSHENERIKKYSEIVDVYKQENQKLRDHLEAAEAELKIRRNIADTF